MSSNPNAGTQMFWIRQSDNQAYCFSPVPLITESVENITLIKDGTSQRIGSINRLTFNGTLLPELPALSGVDENSSCLQLLDRKSDQLKLALDEDYGNLLIVDSSGYPVLSVYPRVTSIEFPESQMVAKRDYQISFEYESDFSSDCKISDFSETWGFNQNEDDTSSVTHTISAVGINDLPAGTGAVRNAKNFVLSRANSLDRTQYSFLKSPHVDTILDLDNLTEYNHIRSESIDEAAGSYELTESWVLASGAFKDDRSIELSYQLNELGELIGTETINGTVQGYGDTTFDRYDNAVDGFVNFVTPQINFNSTSGVVSRSRTDNRFAGTVNYSISFEPDDTTVLEDRSVQRQFQRNEDGTVSQTVTTNARVRLSSPSGIQAAIDYCILNNYPIDSTIEPFFAASLSGNIESVSSTRDELQKSFSLTKVYRDQGVSLWREEYQVSREQSLENAITTITVNGTVAGLAAETGTTSRERFNAASGAYFGTVKDLIRTRALSILESGSCIGTRPITSSLGYNIQAGIITYSQTFDNRFLTSNANITNEVIEVNYNRQADVIAEIGIPGKSDGPILQDQETTTGLEKSIRISYTMAPSGDMCGQIDGTTQYLLEEEGLRESNILINNTRLENDRGEKPIATAVFKTQDQYSFDRRGLVFSRNVTWKYTAS